MSGRLKYRAILASFYGQPLAILPAKLEQIRAFLHLKAAGGDVPPEEIAAIVAARRAGGVTMAGRVAVLPVMGTLCQRVGAMEEASGGVGAEAIGAALDGLMGDRSVKCVVMAFDSCGGSVFGIGELAAKVRGYRGQKKIVGLADSVAASAAYWLLSQCSEVNVTPGGQVGSVGVVAAHEDHSAALEQAGVKVTYVTAGKYKAEGAAELPLSEEARQELQSKVDAYYQAFVADVAKGRDVSEAKVKSDFGQGRMLTAKEAVAAGAADRVATLEQVLRRCGASDGPSAEAAGVPLAARLAAYRARAVGLDD